jgi:hypothetical protein
MSTGTTVVIVVIAVIVIGAVVAVAYSAARRRRLQQRFGPEYDRLVTEHDSKLKAEAELARRERRVSKLDIKPLDPAERTRYAQEWATIQEQFVDAPQGAVAQAQNLVVAVMRERGYPTDDQDQLMADLSVEHAAFLDHYRAASAISEQAASGTPSTEDLRQAMIHYRALFKDLLGGPADSAATTTGTGTAADTGTAAGTGTAEDTAAGTGTAAGPAGAAERDTVIPDREQGTAEPVAGYTEPDRIDADSDPADVAASDPADVAAERARNSVAGQSPAGAPAETEPADEPVVDTDPVHDDLHVVTPDDVPVPRAERAPADTLPDETPVDLAPPADTEAGPAPGATAEAPEDTEATEAPEDTEASEAPEDTEASEDTDSAPEDTEPEHVSLADSVRRRIGR